MQLYNINDTGLSTVKKNLAERHAADGYPVEVIGLPVRTLADICREYAPPDIHFLKIDVEGAEEEVLRGADFTTYRPWIVLVEATIPNSRVENWEAWDPLLTKAGYSFVWFDGLNRFYLASERAEELGQAFLTPPNFFDHWVRPQQMALLSEVHALEAAMDRLQEETTKARANLEAETMAARSEAQAGRAEANAARAEASALQAAMDRLQEETTKARANLEAEAMVARNEAQAGGAEANAARAEASALQAAMDRLQEERTRLTQSQQERERALFSNQNELRSQLSSLQQYVDAVHVSTSWRITAPLRFASRGARWFVRGSFAWLMLKPGSRPRRVARRIRSGLKRHMARLVKSSVSGDNLHRDTDPRPPSQSRPPGGPTPKHGTVRKIHQFHSGSATGDAITNSMFLIQSLLRDNGFESNIYVEHRHPDLKGSILELDDLPHHNDYILIVHHSMGYTAFNKVVSLPVEKILIYHNITPPEFLTDTPDYIHYGRLGRRQLLELSSGVRAALAVSEFNAIELREYGYSSVAVCHLLFDVASLQGAAERAAKQDRSQEAFTVLFVGRLISSKAQADLVDAFAAFKKLWKRSARLVLVGRPISDESAYMIEIRARIRRHNLQADVIITGYVNDDELHNWYRNADVFVSLSHHEGFGVPLVEAMVHKVPVIAWPAAAVPYTLAKSGVHLVDREPETVAIEILKVASDPELRQRLVLNQDVTLRRFEISRHLPMLTRALTQAGADIPFNRQDRQQVAANLQFVITGHFHGSYSLAEVNRSLASAIESHSPGSVRIRPWESGSRWDPDNIPPAYLEMLKTIYLRGPTFTRPIVTISQHYPIHVPEDRGDCALAMVFWEESLLSAEMVQRINTSFDALLAPSEFCKKVFVDSGVSIPVYNVGFCPNISQYIGLGARRLKRPHRQSEFNFLHVSSCFPRKGADALLEAYVREFRKRDDVILTIKSFPNPHNSIEAQIERIQKEDPNAPRIVLINEHVDTGTMLGLYENADVVVLPSRGEGFNLPALEALASAVPLVVTGFGSHLDFCEAAHARFIDYAFSRARSHLSTPGSAWVEPDGDDLRKALRELYEDKDGVAFERAANAHRALTSRFSADKWVAQLREFAALICNQNKNEPVRSVWITTWDVRCGIAEYSRFLLGEVFEGRGGSLASPTIFCDDRTAISSSSGYCQVHAAWTAGHFDAAVVARLIAKEDPSAVVIQHQPGLISWSALSEFVQDPRLLNRATIVTLHSVLDLLELPQSERLEVIGALECVSRVLVHRLEDVNLLRDVGLSSNVTYFPHGTPKRLETPPVRQLSRRESPIIGSFGFFLKGKGIDRLINSFALVRKETFPNARLHLINAEYPADVSRIEIENCKRLASDLGVGGAIVWDTDYHDHEVAMAKLRECDILVLPYDDSKEAASGALRCAIASGVPVAVTPVRIFLEADDAVYRFSDLAPSTIANELSILLSNAETRMAYQKSGGEWLESYSWPGLGRRFRGMLIGLVRDMETGKAVSAMGE